MRRHIQKTEAKLQQSETLEHQLRAEINSLHNKLHHMIEDPVTGVLSWSLFEDRLSQRLKESERYQLTMGVLFVDIDDFKVVNDALGYETGNTLLRFVAERLQSCVRQVDSVSRFTKDTFVVLLAQLAKPETAAIVAQRILQSLSQAFKVHNHELFITASIGIAIYPSDGEDGARLLRNADKALHLAKQKSQHIYQFYQENIHDRSQLELSIYTSLSRDSIFKELVVYYQPIVDVMQEKLCCMDTCLMWQHPILDLIPTQDLFIYAEKQRKLNNICEWLMKEACQEFLHWRSLGFQLPYLGIPISIKQLENTHFIYRISHILQTLSFNPAWLLLRLKDSSTELSSDVLEKSLNMLEYLGIQLVIDDFGAGSFGLKFLQNYRLNFLKIAKSLTDDVMNNRQSVVLIESILNLAKELNIQVIVQGVDNKEQFKLLKELGCSLMQGDVIGKPLSVEDVIAKHGSLQSKGAKIDPK